jgi:hypothetical protein
VDLIPADTSQARVGLTLAGALPALTREGSDDAATMAEAAYRDDKFEPELCHHCGVSYRGPALYCSLICAIADA